MTEKKGCGDCTLCDHSHDLLSPVKGYKPPETGSSVKFDPSQENVGVETSVFVWCKRCGTPYHSSRDKCPYCGFTKQEEKVETELERAEKNIRRAKGLDQMAVLSVGDLTPQAEERRRNRAKDGMRVLKNREKGLTVGDLTGREDDKRGLDQLFIGGPLIEAHVSEAEEIKMDMMKKHRKKQEEIQRMRNLIFEQQQEKELRREAARQGLKL